MFEVKVVGMCSVQRCLAAFIGIVILAWNAAGGAEKNPDVTFHSAPAPLVKDAITSDWPCVLGPTHNEVSPETRLIRTFPPAGPKVIWEMVKGEGYAAAVVAEDRLVVFHRVGDEEVIDCLNPTNGDRYWRSSTPTAYQDEYGYCNGPRSSPTISNGDVFAIGAEGKLRCLDLMTGAVRWQHDVAAEYKLRQNFFGVGSSPLVEGNVLIVNVGAAGGPCVVGYDIKSGKVAWTAGKQWGPSYASPVPAVLHGKRRVLVFAGGRSNPPSGGLICIDPTNGKIDFEFPWRGTVRESVNASSPVTIGDQVFISECYGSGGTLLNINADISCTQAWINPNFGTHFMSAIYRDGYLYGVDGHGPEDAFLACVDLKSGKEIWRTQPQWNETIGSGENAREASLGLFRCWLMPVDGRVLCLGEYGHLVWADLSPKGYREISRATLFSAGETWTPPVLSKGLLYICQSGKDVIHHTGPRLLCYDMRGGDR
jgi:outer membrane protein assembly factor BamB